MTQMNKDVFKKDVFFSASCSPTLIKTLLKCSSIAFSSKILTLLRNAGFGGESPVSFLFTIQAGNHKFFILLKLHFEW